MREFPRPRIEVEETDYGMRVITLREISATKTHIRVTNLMFPNAFVIPMSREMTITPVARADRRHAPLLVRDLHQLRRAGRQGRDAPPAPRALRIARLRAAQEQEPTTTASIRTSRRTRPSPAWGPTSTCTTNGPANRWARSRTAPTSISASPTRRSPPTGACCAAAIDQAHNGGRPLMVLDPQSAPKVDRAGGDRRHRPDRRLGRATGSGPTRASARPRAGPNGR